MVDQGEAVAPPDEQQGSARSASSLTTTPFAPTANIGSRVGTRPLTDEVVDEGDNGVGSGKGAHRLEDDEPAAS
jgi:hypothetical protein